MTRGKWAKHSVAVPGVNFVTALPSREIWTIVYWCAGAGVEVSGGIGFSWKRKGQHVLASVVAVWAASEGPVVQGR